MSTDLDVDVPPVPLPEGLPFAESKPFYDIIRRTCHPNLL